MQFCSASLPESKVSYGHFLFVLFYFVGHLEESWLGDLCEKIFLWLFCVEGVPVFNFSISYLLFSNILNIFFYRNWLSLLSHCNHWVVVTIFIVFCPIVVDRCIALLFPSLDSLDSDTILWGGANGVKLCYQLCALTKQRKQKEPSRPSFRLLMVSMLDFNLLILEG